MPTKALTFTTKYKGMCIIYTPDSGLANPYRVKPSEFSGDHDAMDFPTLNDAKKHVRNVLGIAPKEKSDTPVLKKEKLLIGTWSDWSRGDNYDTDPTPVTATYVDRDGNLWATRNEGRDGLRKFKVSKHDVLLKDSKKNRAIIAKMRAIDARINAFEKVMKADATRLYKTMEKWKPEYVA